MFIPFTSNTVSIFLYSHAVLVHRLPLTPYYPANALSDMLTLFKFLCPTVYNI